MYHHKGSNLYDCISLTLSFLILNEATSQQKTISIELHGWLERGSDRYGALRISVKKPRFCDPRSFFIEFSYFVNGREGMKKRIHFFLDSTLINGRFWPLSQRPGSQIGWGRN